MSHTKYPTRPLKCFRQARDLRMEHYREIMRARENGKILVTGGVGFLMSLPAGIGDYVFFAGEPYGATIAGDIPFLDQCVAATEAKGWAKDLCTYMRNYWGSMYLNKFYFGGEFPRPDFALQMHCCDVHAPWFQVVAEHYNIPFFGVDLPLFATGEKRERTLQYITAQMVDAIDWMERITGRTFDDEKLLEAVSNEWRTMKLWAEITLMNQSIPAPLSERMFYALYTPAILIKHKKEVVAFYELLKEEVAERVADGIGALADERHRIFFDNPPPWYNLDILRYIESYGCNIVGSVYTLTLPGQLIQQENGTYIAAPTPQERGWPLNSREDILYAMGMWELDNGFLLPLAAGQQRERSEQMLNMAKQWRADSVIMHLNRGCEGLAAGQVEARQVLVDSGLPTLAYEGNMGDRRDLDEAATLSRIKSFMEMQGIERLIEG